MLVHEVRDRDDGRLDEEREEEPGDSGCGEAGRRVERDRAPGRQGRRHRSVARRASRARTEAGGGDPRLEDRAVHRDVVVHVRPAGQASSRRYLTTTTSWVVRYSSRGSVVSTRVLAVTRAASPAGPPPARRGSEGHDRERGEDRGEPGEARPQGPLEERQLAQDDRERHREGDLLRPHGEEGRGEHRRRGEGEPPRGRSASSRRRQAA